MSDLASRIYALPPKQRAAVVALVSLLELSARDLTPDNAIGNLNDNYYHHLIFEENDIDEPRRIAQYAIQHYVASIEAGDISNRGLLLMWQLRMADLDMAAYLCSGDVTHKHNALERFVTLEAILTRLPQTFGVISATTNILLWQRRLTAKRSRYNLTPENPLDIKDAAEICEYYSPADFETLGIE